MTNTPAFETSTRSTSPHIRTLPWCGRRIGQWLKQEQQQLSLKVISRVGAALLVGYLAAATLACLLALVLPMPRLESTLTANMLFFLFYAIAIIYAFCVRKIWHAWWNLGLVSMLCFGLIKVCGL